MKPDFANFYYWVARSYFYRDANVDIKKVTDSAKNNFEKFIELEKDTVKNKAYFLESYTYLANYNYHRGLKQESIPYWKKILAIEPKDKTALDAKKILKFE